MLTRATNEVFTPVSRSEFGDVVGMLEVVGLASLSSLLSSTGGSPSKRTFGRSASFGGIAKGKGMGRQGVKIAAGVRVDEVLRGLGIDEVQTETKDIREEEVRGIWERERRRLGRDVKALEIAKGQGKMNQAETFEEAMED